MTTVQLPALDNFITINETEIQEFRKNGHTLIRNVLSPHEISAYREAINSAAYKFNTEKRDNFRINFFLHHLFLFLYK